MLSLLRLISGEVVLYEWVEWLKEEHSHLYQLPQQQAEHEQEEQPEACPVRAMRWPGQDRELSKLEGKKISTLSWRLALPQENNDNTDRHA